MLVCQIGSHYNNVSAESEPRNDHAITLLYFTLLSFTIRRFVFDFLKQRYRFEMREMMYFILVCAYTTHIDIDKNRHIPSLYCDSNTIITCVKHTDVFFSHCFFFFAFMNQTSVLLQSNVNENFHKISRVATIFLCSGIHYYTTITIILFYLLLLRRCALYTCLRAM